MTEVPLLSDTDVPGVGIVVRFGSAYDEVGKIGGSVAMMPVVKEPYVETGPVPVGTSIDVLFAVGYGINVKTPSVEETSVDDGVVVIG